MDTVIPHPDPDAGRDPDSGTTVRSAGALVELGPGDVPRIARLGRESWPPPMQVGEDVIARRFELGHVMLGAEDRARLLGVVAFSYARWSPDDPSPASDDAFSSEPRAARFDTVFAYNLVVHPRLRGSNLSRRLIRAGLARARADGCRLLLGHARCPSYNGSAAAGVDAVPRCPEFRHALDRARASGRVPAEELLMRDPVLRFYRRVLGCTFLRLMPDFLPGDVASGGFAMRFVKTLEPGSRDAGGTAA